MATKPRQQPGKSIRDHDFDDVDKRTFSHHHTLGKKATQAAPGNHTHPVAESDEGITVVSASRTTTVGSIVGSEVQILTVQVPELIVGRLYVILATCRMQSTVSADEVTYRVYLNNVQIGGHTTDLRVTRDVASTIMTGYVGQGETNVPLTLRALRSAGSGTLTTVASGVSPTWLVMM